MRGKQLLWAIGLWLAGIAAVAAVSYGLKLVIGV